MSPLLLLLAALPTLHAQEDVVELWTVARSADIAAAWGHTLLHIRHDGRDLVYNYGRFQRTPTFVLDYLTGDLVYWLDTEKPASARGRYESRGRGVIAQTIHMPADRLDRLVAHLAEEALPAHREFAYDPVVRNCTIRTRDVLDTWVFDGALKTAADATADRPTYRSISESLLAEEPLTRWVAHAMWGSTIDRPLTAWESWGLPDQLHDGFVEIADGRLPLKAPAGVRVDPPRFIGTLQAQLRPEGHDAGWRFSALALGLWGLLFALPAARPSRAAHVGLGLGVLLWSLLGGVAGVALFLLVWQGPDAADGNAVLGALHPGLLMLPLLVPLSTRFAVARHGLVGMLALPVLGTLWGLLQGQTIWPWMLPALLVQGTLVWWSSRYAALEPGT